ncbi:hypothetical protein [Methanobrevibacter sp.]|uniref:hypothetical protein n=1 Tax=Methanobrevibacter sp. TaxID=66852 RepID=UPI003869851C
MDNKASSTIEIAIILIVVLLISGTVLSSFENVTNKIVNAQERENMEILTSQVVDNLINNPGVPDNWFKNLKGTPGLAIVNEGGQTIPNSISYSKFVALGSKYKKLVDERLFNSKIKTSMEIIPQKSSVSSVKIGSNKDSNNVFAVNRIVKCDFYKKYVLKDFQSEGKCNRNHDQSSNSCNYFKVFKGNVKNSNYYLLLDDGEYNLKYIIDTTRVVKARYWQTATSDVICLNDKIDFYDDDSAVVFIHFNKPQTKALLVSVPKNFDRDKLEYDYFRTNECEFILRAWF